MIPATRHPGPTSSAAPQDNDLPDAGLFITGTDTGVGKTFVAAAVAEILRCNGHRVGVYKPVATGIGEPHAQQADSDPNVLRRAAGCNGTLHDVCPQRFALPAAPPVAAAAQGRSVDADLLIRGARRWHNRCDLLIVEGVGGLLCPLTEELTVADLAAQLAYPLVVVARCTLGTLNHTLLTLEVARHRGLFVAAVILNCPEPSSGSLAERTNARELRRRLDCPLFFQLPHLPQPAKCHSPDPLRWPDNHTGDYNAFAANELLSSQDWAALATLH